MLQCLHSLTIYISCCINEKSSPGSNLIIFTAASSPVWRFLAWNKKVKTYLIALQRHSESYKLWKDTVRCVHYTYGTMQLGESNLGKDCLVLVLALHWPSWSCEVLLAVWVFKKSQLPVRQIRVHTSQTPLLRDVETEKLLPSVLAEVVQKHHAATWTVRAWSMQCSTTHLVVLNLSVLWKWNR